jgi:hypothetical protein
MAALLAALALAQSPPSTPPHGVLISGASSATHGPGQFLNVPVKPAVWTQGSSTYAIVTSRGGTGGVQVLDISDPYNPSAVSAAFDGVGGFQELSFAIAVATFDIVVRFVGPVKHAIVTSYTSGGVQVISLDDPFALVPTASASSGTDPFLGGELDGACAVAVWEPGPPSRDIYALVASESYDGFVIVDVTAAYQGGSGLLMRVRAAPRAACRAVPQPARQHPAARSRAKTAPRRADRACGGTGHQHRRRHRLALARGAARRTCLPPRWRLVRRRGLVRRRRHHDHGPVRRQQPHAPGRDEA